jgi:paraquat-inducible protein B
VLYREIRVGSVRSAELAPDATGVLVAIDVEPRFVPLVRDNTRFWRTGGVGVDFGLFSGLSVTADSLENFVSAGVAFATPNRPGEPAVAGQSFDLAESPESGWLGWTPQIDLGKTP